MRSHVNLLSLFLWLVLSLSTLAGYADQQAASEQGKAFADSMNAGIAESAKSPNANDIPQYQGENVAETQYYTRGAAIEDDAQVHATTDDTAQYIQSSRDNRPQYTIDTETDPMFKREDDVVTLSRSLTATYSDCVQLPVGEDDVTKYEEHTCDVTGHQDTINYTCQKNLDVTCSNPDAGVSNPFRLADFTISGDDSPYRQSGDSFLFGSWGNNHRGHCRMYERTIRFYVDDPDDVSQFTFDSIRYDDWLDITINGDLSYRGRGPREGTHLTGQFNCEQKGIHIGSPFSALERIKAGWNTIHIANLVHGYGNYYVQFTLRRIRACNERESITYSCPDGESHAVGNLIDSTCTSTGTRTISGFSIARSCWSWSEQYTRLSDPVFTRSPECSTLESQGCGQISSACVAAGNGFCARQELTYQCSSTEAERHVELCGNLMSCPEGNCAQEYQTQKDATEDFKQAATSMAVANEIAKEFDYENLTVFKGQAKACKKKTAGFSNCCKDGGWGTDVGVANCSTEEKELGIAREEKATHYVGSYCSEDSVLGCLARKNVYCTYPSKLSRIVIEQGNLQLNRDYGTPEDPTCVGFTLDELKSLNFDLMDFSEFYEDVTLRAANGDIGDPNQLINDLTERLSQLGGESE